MSVVGWIALGLIVGLISSRIVSRNRAGTLLDVMLGVIGAVAGGVILSGVEGVGAGWLRDLAYPIIGAVVFLLLYHVVFARTM